MKEAAPADTRPNTHKQTHTRPNTDRLRRLDGHEAVVALLPTDVAEGPVVRDVLGDVGDLVDCMVVQDDLKRSRTVWELVCFFWSRYTELVA